MPQTILSVLALVIFTLFAVSQQRRLMYSQQSMVRNSVAVIANGIAVQTADEAAAQAFDEKTAAGASVNSADSLTVKASFGRGADATPLNDLDDWSSVDTAGDTLASRYRMVGTDSLRFVRKAEVKYVYENPLNSGNFQDSPGQARTKHKRITVTVYSDQVAFADTVTFSRVVSCGIPCDF